MDTLPESWSTFFKAFNGNGLHNWLDTVYSETTFPPREQLFRAFSMMSPQDVKVVILGQDPYHTPGVANGLAFSCNGSLQPSLRNMLRELEDDIGVKRTDGDLESWARQGVLLLNTALCVEKGSPNCYKSQWKAFTDYTVSKLIKDYQHIVFLLWGNNAKAAVRPYKQFCIMNEHCCLEAAHPSPLSASRGFFGEKPYSRANAALVRFGREPVVWA